MNRSRLIGFLAIVVFASLTSATARAGYILRVTESRASEGAPAFVDVVIDPNGTSLAAVAFFVEFDQSRLKFDPVSKGPGLDNLQFMLPEELHGTGMFLSATGRLGISVYDPAAPLTAITTPTVIARLRFDVLPAASGFAFVRVAETPEPNASDLNGALVPAGTIDRSSGGVMITNARPLLRVTPAELSFGTVAPQSRVERNLVLSNDGDAAIEIAEVRLVSGSPSFSLVESPAPGTLLVPGSSRVVRIAFNSGGEGAAGSELRIVAADTTIAVPLTANVSADSWFFDSRWVVPAAARLPGANGSNWQSRVALHNGSDAPLRARLSLYGADGRFFGPATVDLPARSTQVTADVVRELFGETIGGGFILVESSSSDLEVRSETANVSAGIPAGQSVPVIAWTNLFRKGEVAQLIALDRSETARTNVALLNLTDARVALRATVRETDGDVIGERSYILDPMSIRQSIDVFEALQITDATGLTVSIGCETDDCRFFAYASTVDAQGRPLFQSPR